MPINMTCPPSHAKKISINHLCIEIVFAKLILPKQKASLRQVSVGMHLYMRVCVYVCLLSVLCGSLIFAMILPLQNM